MSSFSAVERTIIKLFSQTTNKYVEPTKVWEWVVLWLINFCKIGMPFPAKDSFAEMNNADL